MANQAKSDDYRYTKTDTFLNFGFDFNDQILKLPHMEPGAVLIKVSEKTRLFYEEYYRLCENYHIIDDSPSAVSEKDEFVEHRHDQSVFSLLAKKKNMVNYGLSPYCFDNNSLFNNKQTPFFIIRNRSGQSQIPIYLKYYPDYLARLFGCLGRLLNSGFPRIYKIFKPYFPDQNNFK